MLQATPSLPFARVSDPACACVVQLRPVMLQSLVMLYASLTDRMYNPEPPGAHDLHHRVCTAC